jgi:diguanylate cyclase (GGDEF)-like protein/PAS domain S-box-containing protein
MRILSPARLLGCALLLLLALPLPARSADKVRLQLRWDHQFQFAGYYAAQWQGYYAEAGLDVDILPGMTPQGNVNAVQQVAAGRAEFGVGGADILLANDNPATSLTVLACIFQESPVAFVSLPDTPMGHPSDLVRLRVLRRQGDLVDLELMAMLQAEGLDQSLVGAPPDLPPKPESQLLLDRDVDVIPVYDFTLPALFGPLANKLHVLLPENYGVDFYGDSLFCSLALAQRNPDLVRRFTAASLKGWEYALDHAEEICDRIARDLPRVLPIPNPLSFNLHLVEGVRRLARERLVSLGHMNSGRWARMHQTLSDLGLVSRPLDLKTFIFDPTSLEMQVAEQQRIRLLIGLAVLLAASLGILLWSIALRRAVARRTRALEAERNERRLAEESLRLAMEAASDGVWDWNLISGQTFFNPSYFTMLGYAPGELPSLQKTWRELVHPDDLERVLDQFTTHLQSGTPYAEEMRMRAKDGHWVWVLSRGKVVEHDERGRPVRMVGTHVDISARKAAEEALLRAKEDVERQVAERTEELSKANAELRREIDVRRRAQEQILKLSRAVEQSPASVIITDPQGIIQYVNPKFTRVTGYRAEEVVGQRPSLLKSGAQPPEFYGDMWKTLAAGQEWHGEFCNRAKDGTEFWESASISPVFDTKGRIIHYVAVKEDITEKKRQEEHIRHLALHDALTGLPNRVLGMDRLKHAMERANREEHKVALLYLDLDGFKPINDSLGHDAGDEALRQVADRITDSIRKVDTAARMGGDEFVVILSDVWDAQFVELAVRRILKALAQEMECMGSPCSVQASIGVCVFPDHGQDPETLLRNADTAMYQAKKAGGNRFVFYRTS